MDVTDGLGVADYGVIALTLIVSSGIGIYYRFTGGRQKTTEEYFVANRSMGISTVAIGLMASYLSAVSLLGVSSENYVYGTQYAVINFSYGLATPFVAYLYLPVFFNLGATSAFEYLDKRFGNKTRVVASSAFLLQLFLYTGVVLYAPALALEATTGISTTLSIVIIGLVCTFYSTIGGIKAVLVTDIFQSLLMFVAVITVIVTAAASVGGLDEIWRIAEKGQRIQFDNISPDPTVRHTWWSLTIGGFFTYLSLYGVNQVQVQRMLTVKSNVFNNCDRIQPEFEKHRQNTVERRAVQKMWMGNRDLKSAQKALWWSWPIASTMSLITCFSGLAIYSKYYDCDPLKSKRITSNDQLMPRYVMDTLSRYPGVAGLFIAGIFSAGLSTVSATLNSLAAVILEDYVKPICLARGKRFSAKTSAYTSKAVAFLVGLMCLAVAFLARYLGGVLQAALTIFGVVGGPMLGLFTLGMMTESANEAGAITGIISSLAFSLWIGFGQPKPRIYTLPVETMGCNVTVAANMSESYSAREINDESYFYLYRLSYMWYCPIGFVTCLLVGLLGSCLARLVYRAKPKEMDPNLFMPFVASRIIKTRQRKKNNFYNQTLEYIRKYDARQATVYAG